jgi:O-antigen/teichoic acid export membrane protein
MRRAAWEAEAATLMGNPKFKAFWDFVSLSSGEIVSKLVGFLAFAYLARALEPEFYGHVELAVALLVFFSALVEFGFGTVGARQIANFPQQAERFSNVIISARLLLVLVLVPLMCLVAPFMTKSHQAVTLIVVFSFALLPMPWNQRWLLQGLDQMVLVSLGQMLRMMIFALGVILFVKGPEDLLKVGFVEIGAVLTMLAYFLAVQRRFNIPVRLTFRPGELIDLGRQSAAIGLSMSVWALNQYLPMLLVANIAGSVQVAWFGAAMRIVASLASFSALYHFNLNPVLNRRFKISRESLLELIEPSSRVTAWVGIFIALIFTLYARPVAVTVFGASFHEAETSLRILIWFLPLTLLSGHARWLLVAAHKQRYLFYAQLSGLATTLAGGLLLIPDYGSAGASWTIVLANAAVLFAAYFFASKHVLRLPCRFVLVPAFTALGVLVPAFLEVDRSWYHSLLYLALFAAIAMLVDRRVSRDVRTLLKIKNIDSPLISPQANE